jgi:hypothetical protein
MKTSLEELERKIIFLERKILVIEFLLKTYLPKNSDPGGAHAAIVEEIPESIIRNDPRSEDSFSSKNSYKSLKTVLPTEDAKDIADALQEAQEARRGATEALERANKAMQIASRKSDQMSKIELDHSKKK